MKLAMIGLGKMGINLTENLIRNNNEVVAFDLNEESKQAADKLGAHIVDSLEAAVENLSEPKIVWVMLPAGGPTNSTIDKLSELLNKGDIVIDGGNSFYEDSLKHNEILKAHEINFFDVGTSGGMSGANQDGNFMIGGDDAEVFKYIEPIFEGIAMKDGYLYTGKAGSGHYLKMVHNGIEYGLMQAYAEGFDILKNKDSERLPEDERFTLYLPDIAEVWRRGSVISSWLLDLSASALARDQSLEQFTGKVADSGEGRWTIEAAMEEAVPANVLSAALYARYRSRSENTYGDRLLSAMRFGFGGHVEMPQ